MAGWPPHISIVETISIIKSMITIKSPYELGNWAIVLKSNNKMIGTIELYNHYYKFKAELGYSINPAYWSNGYATEAAKEVISYGFEFLDLKRIEAEIERLEARSEELDALLEDPAVYTDHTKLLNVTKEKDEKAERLSELMEPWEELAD